jgi:hypothetical protein
MRLKIKEFVQVTDPNTFMGCDVGTQKIVFLTGLSATVSTDHRSCTTDKTTFLVPLINVECSTAEGNGTTFERLARCAKEDFADYFTALNLTIDGQPIGDLNSLRVHAKGISRRSPTTFLFLTSPSPQTANSRQTGIGR